VKTNNNSDSLKDARIAKRITQKWGVLRIFRELRHKDSVTGDSVLYARILNTRVAMGKPLSLGEFYRLLKEGDEDLDSGTRAWLRGLSGNHTKCTRCGRRVKGDQSKKTGLCGVCEL
jgi:hypothetical protein